MTRIAMAFRPTDNLPPFPPRRTKAARPPRGEKREGERSGGVRGKKGEGREGRRTNFLGR